MAARWAIPAALFFVTLLTRLPFATQHLWGWDAVLYARAIDSFDPAAQRPHPPGYLWFVLLARAVDALVGDANRALVLISAVAAAFAVPLLYLLCRRLYDETTARVAALYLLTAVTFWAYGAVAYPYTLLAALSVALAFLFWGAIERPGAALLVASAAWGVAVGFRSDLAIYLAPLWLFAAWRARLAAAIAGAGLFAALAGGWLLATGAGAGGLDRWWTALRDQGAYLERTSSVLGRGLDALFANLRELARFLGRGLYALAMPMLALFLSPEALRAELARPTRALFLVLWIAPPLAVYVLLHVGDYGHVFNIIPACCVVAARGTRALAWLGRRFALNPARVALAVALANALVFLWTDTPLSAADLRRRDRSLDEKVAYVRALDAGAYLVSAYDAVVIEHYLGDPRHVLVRYDVLEPPVRRAVPTASRVVVWDDVLRVDGPGWETVTLRSGTHLRVVRLGAAAAIVMVGPSVRLEPAD